MKDKVEVKTSMTIDRISKLWRHPLEISLCFLLAAIVVITFLQVLFRYVFQTSLAWTEELARFAFLWTAALSVGYAFKTKSHFALRFMVDQFGPGLKRIISTLVTFLMTIFLIIFTWKAVQYVESADDQVAPGTGLPMVIPYSSVVVAGLLMLYYVMQNWWEEMTIPKSQK